MNEFQIARTKMVDCQVRTSDVTDHDIIDAMLEIPRENFVSEQLKALAYIDVDLPVGKGVQGEDRYLIDAAQFAKLLQLANVQSDAIVLDVGCATGYSTAILSKLCASVVALENDVALAGIATNNLDALELGNAVVVQGPLEDGYAKEGPYDCIFVGGSVECDPVSLVNQLKNGGNLVTVMGSGNSAIAKTYLRRGSSYTITDHFNSSLKPLPGFSKEREFVF